MSITSGKIVIYYNVDLFVQNDIKMVQSDKIVVNDES